jgi:hypothetical protein
MFSTIPKAGRGALSSFWTLFWILVCLHQLYFGWFLVKSSFIPYVMDGNETFSVWWHAHNLYTFSFWKSFGLTDESYGLTEASHPFFHTHQGNMPRLFGFLIYALGARTVESQVLITTLIIGNLTLFFCYASISKLTRPTIAFVFCLFLFSDYLLYAQWHVVTYRVWSGFLFFGILFAISSTSERNIAWPYLLLGTLFFLLFYGELVFAVYVSIAAGLYGVWLYWREPRQIAKLYAAQLVGGLAALALLFTQLVMVFGPDVVRADFSTTFLARNATSLGTSAESIAGFFRDHNIVFWGNFRDGASLRKFDAFARSIDTYIFQVWTPSFLILIVVPLIATLVSLIENRQRGALIDYGNRDTEPLSSCMKSRRLEVLLVGPKGRRPIISLSISLAEWRQIGQLLALVLTSILAFKAIMEPGALFGVVADRAPSMLWMALSEIAIAGSMTSLVFGHFSRRPSLIATSRGVLTIALCAVLIGKSPLLFDQTYSPIWEPLFHNWKVRVVFRLATIAVLTASVAIAVFGAERSFGTAAKVGILRASVFLLVGFASYAIIYILSPGYVLSGYAERYAPFSIFFLAMLPACAIYALAVASERFARWSASRFKMSAPVRRTVVPMAVLLLIAFPLAYWAKVQVYHSHLFPPDHVSFLQKIKSAPLRGGTFAVDNYAAPIAYFAENWAYIDHVIGSDWIFRDDTGGERRADQSLRWLADSKLNPAYDSPRYFVCMRMPNFNSVLALSDPERFWARFEFCDEEPIFGKGDPYADRILASDLSPPRFWSIAMLGPKRPTISDLSTALSLRGDRLVFTNRLDADAAIHISSKNVELLAKPNATDCDANMNDLAVIQASNDGADLSVPSNFRGLLLMRAQITSDNGISDWKGGELWLVRSTSASVSEDVIRCPSIVANGSFGRGGLRLQDKGWGKPEIWGTWSVGPRSTLLPIPIPKVAQNSDFLVEAKVRAFLPGPGRLQTITVEANGAAVGKWAFSDSGAGHVVTARIPGSILKGHSRLTLSFDIADPASPASLGESSDSRELGLGITQLKVQEIER